MISTHYSNSSLSYTNTAPSAMETNRSNEAQNAKRENFGSSLLDVLDQRGYDAFLKSTDHLSSEDKKLAAQTLERTAAISAANEYAIDHDVDMATDLSLVYAFFENYQDVVSSDQIKHLLNTRLASSPEITTPTFDSEDFINDYMNQVSGRRALDIRV